MTTNFFSFPSLLAALLAAPLAAQLTTTATWTAENQLRCKVDHEGVRTATAPATTDLAASGGFLLDATWKTRFARFATTYRATTGGGLRCEITESTHARHDGENRAQCWVGPNTTLIRIVPSDDVSGVIRIRYTTQRHENGPNGSSNHVVRVDVGADGTNDFSAAEGDRRTVDLLVRVPRSGLLVRTYTDLYSRSSNDRAYYESDLEVEFVPPAHAQFSTWGSPCGGLTLAGSQQYRDGVHDYLLDSAGAPAFSVGAEAIGVAPLALPIPGTDCLLLVDPLIVVPIGFDANGETRLIHSLPWDLAVDVRAQVFAFEPTQLTLLSSNGLRIDGVR